MYNNYCISCLPSGVSIDSAPFYLSLLSNMPAVNSLAKHHLVIDEIPPGSHPTHIPDLQTESHKDNYLEKHILLPFDKEPPTVNLRGGLPPVYIS